MRNHSRGAVLCSFLVASCGASPAESSPPDALADAAGIAHKEAGGFDSGTPRETGTRDAAVASHESGPPVVDTGAPPSDAPTEASNYALGSMWLCGANASHDYCLDPQTVTAIHPDLSQTTSTPSAATSPSLDCFYVYPSVDITTPAGNEPNFDNLSDILDPVRSQAAPFSQVCKVYAPLYHQATYQSYFSANADDYLEAAYADVAKAFAEYMTTYNQGRPFVLLGHSQGSHMLRRLIQRVVEASTTVHSQLSLAVLAGSLGDYYVPNGGVVGGSFQTTPLCTAVGQRGCAISFNTFAQGYEPPSSGYPDFAIPAGMDAACSNPAAPGGGEATLADTWFYTKYASVTLNPPQNSGVSTPFASYATFYTGQCTPSAGGYSFFEINPSPGMGDQRTNPIPFSNLYYTPTLLGLHLLDFAFPMGDLLAAVGLRAGSTDGGMVTEAGAHDAAKD